MLQTTLQLSQKLLQIGENEDDVAIALLQFLANRYPVEAINYVGMFPPIRSVCKNTIYAGDLKVKPSKKRMKIHHQKTP
jgi:hypothetical protein